MDPCAACAWYSCHAQARQFVVHGAWKGFWLKDFIAEVTGPIRGNPSSSRSSDGIRDDIFARMMIGLEKSRGTWIPQPYFEQNCPLLCSLHSIRSGYVTSIWKVLPTERLFSLWHVLRCGPFSLDCESEREGLQPFPYFFFFLCRAPCMYSGLSFNL